MALQSRMMEIYQLRHIGHNGNSGDSHSPGKARLKGVCILLRIMLIIAMAATGCLTYNQVSMQVFKEESQCILTIPDRPNLSNRTALDA